MIKIGAELVTETTWVVTPNDEYHLELYYGDVPIPESAGTDRFEMNCHILPQKTLAATGRMELTKIGYGLGPVEAKGANPVLVTEENLPDLKLRFKNTKILDLAELKHNFSIRLDVNGKTVDLLLARPDVKVFWEARGDFVIPLGIHIA